MANKNEDDDSDDNEQLRYDNVCMMLLRPISPYHNKDVIVDEEDNHVTTMKRRVYNSGAGFLSDQGSCVLPRDTLWYINNVKNPRVHDARFCHSFRLRFRPPHERFVEL